MLSLYNHVKTNNALFIWFMLLFLGMINYFIIENKRILSNVKKTFHVPRRSWISNVTMTAVQVALNFYFSILNLNTFISKLNLCPEFLFIFHVKMFKGVFFKLMSISNLEPINNVFLILVFQTLRWIYLVILVDEDSFVISSQL